MLNKMQIIGNLTKDPEVKNGVAKFTVAVNEKFKTKDGEQKETTEFFNCAMFGRLADVAENYFTKGMKVYLEGKLNTREYEGKYYTTVNVQNFSFLGGGQQATKEKTINVSQEPDFSDDIPFN
ncbi:MAG: putative single-stranded DNA-binding protein [Prokaryotic dsDNA virus sp.]|nr:MAG: putative single-stranded DNA-binding protein [Prokaryotic dsDNA virus sp.]|tara:strand:- start:33872 stop:34240 length:369 start_codon:yes stop_codon:yes gene_type:complete